MMFGTKHDAEKWIERYATGTLLVPQKVGSYWRVVPLGVPLSESEIHRIEEKHEMREDK